MELSLKSQLLDVSNYKKKYEESETSKHVDQAVNMVLINNIYHRPHFSRRIGYTSTTFDFISCIFYLLFPF